MLMVFIYVLDALLSVIGLAVVMALLYIGFYFTCSTVWSKEVKAMGYKFQIETTKGRNIIFEMKK